MFISPLLFCIILLRVQSILSYQSQIKQQSWLSYSRSTEIKNILRPGSRTVKTSINVVSPEFKSKSFSSIEERVFKLNEVIENEVSECTIRLATNGKITFLQDESGEKDSNACVVSGSWKHENNNLRMVIDRVFIVRQIGFVTSPPSLPSLCSVSVVVLSGQVRHVHCEVLLQGNQEGDLPRADLHRR